MVDEIKSLWNGICSVYVREEVFSSHTGRTNFIERLVFENEPCRVSYRMPFRLSFKATATASESIDAATLRQTISLYISNKVDIPAGSKIVVTQNGITEIYHRSSKPAVYSNHQEVLLELFNKWA